MNKDEPSLSPPGLSTVIPDWCGRHRWLLWAAVMALFLAGFNNQWRIGTDSSLHLNIGRCIAQGMGFTHPDGLQEMVSPGLAYMTAAGFYLFGPDHLLLSHVINFLLGVAGLGLTYWLFSLHTDRGTAVLMTVLLGTSETYYRHIFLLLTDLPFAVGALLGLVGYERLQQRSPRVWLSVLLIAAGIVLMAMFRAVVLTFIVALALAMLVDLIRAKRTKTLLALTIGLLAAVLASRLVDPNLSHPFQLNADEQIIYQRLVEKLPQTLEHAWSHNLPLLLRESTSEAVFAVDFGDIAGVFLSLASLACMLLMAVARRRSLWLILTLLFLVQWLAFFVADRYYLPLMPLVLYGWWWGAMQVERRLPRGWGRYVLIFMLVLLIVPNLIRVGRFIQVQRSTAFVEDYRRGRYQPIVELAGWMSTHVEANALVLSDKNHSQVLSYLSRRHVIEPRNAGQPPAGPFYVVEPLDEAGRRLLAERGYRAGQALFDTGSPDRPGWSIHPALPVPADDSPQPEDMNGAPNQ